MSGRERLHCMISTCSWYYERDSGPTSAELERALMFGPEEASRDRAMRTNAILREHFELAHTLEEWVTEIGKERKRADRAERELAEFRAKLAEMREEWAVRWPAVGGYHYEICDSEEEAREADPQDGSCEVVKRAGSDWQVAE
jgi:hypothetical protein